MNSIKIDYDFSKTSDIKENISCNLTISLTEKQLKDPYYTRYIKNALLKVNYNEQQIEQLFIILYSKSHVLIKTGMRDDIISLRNEFLNAGISAKLEKKF